ncbi:hypothetical protein KMW28_05540 [Flammeovirga yaeyamensis]|uniref:DUF6985 domain-containing protein n=1 Tax=Flammeovirga yaeyamensis TaxID=367791 RepID=A0AAX1N6E5_9BACT|nr:hypothetical protein [Flammeovirga yaeyamensis]MBB3697628.1 hypothetical protein [Flammeovirga yaeyamensis]NMF36318.1 hypothetical protein [Flammeovirga yaeyamensis]QWG03045.1 hypothetical protein KMW28_05540 [Flammeovirga yaeyamensis]
MEKYWKHSNWGKFKYEEETLIGEIPLPEFNIFNLENLAPENGKYELTLQVEPKKFSPKISHIQIIENLIKNQKEIVSKIPTALWNDFNGIGPDSGMWWNGDIEEVLEGMEEKELSKESDINSLLSLSGIWIHEEFTNFETPLIELAFHASFEEEHGVGILTDSNTIIGAGYIMDVSPYENA